MDWISSAKDSKGMPPAKFDKKNTRKTKQESASGVWVKARAKRERGSESRGLCGNRNLIILFIHTTLSFLHIHAQTLGFHCMPSTPLFPALSPKHRRRSLLCFPGGFYPNFAGGIPFEVPSQRENLEYQNIMEATCANVVSSPLGSF
ncbi:hypothetical protein CEXT_450731 [Caerostris extrusa]|uniref:Uncharacterized protein n=1 Tax=Caerostris extrusa TaxID=172846 RepID=A0AAV4T1V3_CAEEX|nr:hypothetical protein CEXT_450731 [Caerostris extrusa]